LIKNFRTQTFSLKYFLDQYLEDDTSSSYRLSCESNCQYRALPTKDHW